MAQKTRIITVIDDVQVIEVRTHGIDGDPLETYYYVQEEKYSGLKQARDAARRISDERAATKRGQAAWYGETTSCRAAILPNKQSLQGFAGLSRQLAETWNGEDYAENQADKTGAPATPIRTSRANPFFSMTRVQFSVGPILCTSMNFAW